MTFAARIEVMLKDGVADPQGQTIEQALPALGMTGVADVRVGKNITLNISASNATEAHARVVEMCEHLLANPVIETYTVEVEGVRIPV
jgi:phosphoribosylformylglycinamidine synthase PurS subunit